MGSRRGCQRGLPKLAAALLAALLVAQAPGLTGCYGSFPLTKLAFKFNGAISPKPAQTLVFWAFLALPVYSSALSVDCLVLNVVEYWTGARVEFARVEGGNGTLYTFAPSPDHREAILSLSQGGTTTSAVRFVRTPDNRVEIRGADGRLLGQVVPTPQGGLTLTDAEGRLVQGLSAEQIAAIRAR